jgi:hypothetical protein
MDWLEGNLQIVAMTLRRKYFSLRPSVIAVNLYFMFFLNIIICYTSKLNIYKKTNNFDLKSKNEFVFLRDYLKTR